MTDKETNPAAETGRNDEEFAGRSKIVSNSDRITFHQPKTNDKIEQLRAKSEQMINVPPLRSGSSPTAATAMMPAGSALDFHTPAGSFPPPPPKPGPDPLPPADMQEEDPEPDAGLPEDPDDVPFEICSRFIVGLSLCENEVSAARLEQDRLGIQIARAGGLALENPSITNTAATIRSLWKTKRLSSRTVWANVQTRLMIQKYFTFQGEPEELEEILLPEAEELLQMPAKEIACDFHINDVAGPGRELCGMMYALPRWELKRILTILKRAGLFVCGVSSVPCDLARVYKGFYPESFGRSPRGILHLTQETADFIFLFGRHSMYTRTVLSRAGGWDRNLPYLVKCINDATLYFGSWVCEEPVDRFDLCGRIPNAEDLTGFLLRETGIPISYWYPFQPDAEVFPSAKSALDVKDASQWISCIAAGLRGD